MESDVPVFECVDVTKIYGKERVANDAVEAEKVVHRVAIVRDGRVAALGRPADLKREIGQCFRLELTGPPGPPALPGWVRYTEPEPGRWLAVLDKADVAKLLTTLDVHRFDDLRLNSATLEDLYLHYAGIEALGVVNPASALRATLTGPLTSRVLVDLAVLTVFALGTLLLTVRLMPWRMRR